MDGYFIDAALKGARYLFFLFQIPLNTIAQQRPILKKALIFKHHFFKE